MSKGGFVYIMTNAHHTTLYTGVTADIQARVIQHKEMHFPKSFTARYNIDKLVYYQFFDAIEPAIAEEKRIKGGSRQQKIDLINAMNSYWRDLYEDIKDW